MSGASSTLGYVAGSVPFSAVDGPGNRYVVFFQGCGLDCLTCHNPSTIPQRPRRMAAVSVAEVVSGIARAAPFLTGVTISGGECTQQPEFLAALLSQLREDPATRALSRYLDSNGDAPQWVWDLVAPLADGVMLDLKALDEQTHVVLTGGSNRRVLASIEYLAGLGLLREVRLLLVPGLNDAPSMLAATARWLRRIDAAVPVRVLGYRARGTRACARGLLEPTAADLRRYRDVLAGESVPLL